VHSLFSQTDAVELSGAAGKNLKVFNGGADESNFLDLLTVSFKELPKLSYPVDALQVLFNRSDDSGLHQDATVTCLAVEPHGEQPQPAASARRRSIL
jgi:hypothetical protein